MDSQVKLPLSGLASQQTLNLEPSLFTSPQTLNLEPSLFTPRQQTLSAPYNAEEKAPTPPAGDPDTILTGKKLALVFVAMLLSLLLIALDETILSTALPVIASDFDAFALQGWVAMAFPLAQTVFILFYGQIMLIFPAKWILISAISIFEAGSLVCGISHNVNQLIAGRTIGGLGAAGMYVGMIQVISQATRLEDRPRLFGLFGAVFLSCRFRSLICNRTLLGGAFTDHLTWRWCFFINLPLGGASILGVLVFLKAAPPLGSDPSKSSFGHIVQQILGLDFLGATLIAGAITSLELALQWGGSTKPWGDKDIIICFVVAAVLGALYVAWEMYLGAKAMTPTAIFKSRSIWGILVYAFLGRFALFLYSYYIPIYYQAVHHHSATKSGLDLLPFMLAIVIIVISCGQISSKIGRYWPFLVIAPTFLAVGSGLLYTLDTSTPNAALIGFQILAGIGTGMGMQNVILAMQVEFDDAPRLLGQATSMVSFAQFFGGTIGLGIAEPVLASELAKNLVKYAPDAPALIVEESPIAIYTAIPTELVPGVVRAYTESLRIVFLLGVPVAIIALLSSLLIQNLKIETVEPPTAASKPESTE
ncbi:transporter [Mycena galopus ATCC 62051]|nr:transporter [Mycena galopus ATCC 62051]